MKPLEIQGSDVTLTTILDKEKGIFEFTGRSRPENVLGYFEPIFAWLEEYKQDPNPQSIFNFKLEYYNSSSAKVLLRLFVKFEEYYNDGMDIKIHWHYPANDEDILESGEDYASLVKLPFTFHEL